MGSMLGVRALGNRVVQVDEFQIPAPSAGDVRIKILGAGVCGSDLRPYRSKPEDLGERRKIILGHEPAGLVDALGQGARGLAVGDRVVVYHAAGCGHCRECKAFRPQYCASCRLFGLTDNGSDAEYMLAPAHHCHVLPDEVSFEDAALASCIAGTGWSALRQQEVTAADTVAVYGLGPLGLATALLAKALGARVVGTEPSGPRRELAKEIGVDVVIDPVEGGAVEAVRAAAGGAVSKAVEASGNATSRTNAIELAAPHGSIVMVGIGAKNIEVDAEALIGRQLRLIGSWTLEPDEMEALLDFMGERDLSFDPIITHRFPLSEAQQAFDTADSRGTGRVMFSFD